MRRKKIIFISGSRSDFGLIQSVLKSFANSSGYSVVLIRVGHSIASEEDFNKKLEKSRKQVDKLNFIRFD